MQKIADAFPERNEAESTNLFLTHFVEKHKLVVQSDIELGCLKKEYNKQTSWKDIVQFFGLLLRSGYSFLNYSYKVDIITYPTKKIAGALLKTHVSIDATVHDY